MVNGGVVSGSVAINPHHLFSHILALAPVKEAYVPFYYVKYNGEVKAILAY